MVISCKLLTYNNIGDIYIRQKQYDEAENYLKKALTNFQKVYNQRGIAYCYNQLALLYENKNVLDKSLKYNFKALEIRQLRKDLDGLAASTRNIGSIYLKQKKYDLAYKAFIKSIEYDTQLNHLQGISESYYRLGQYWVDLKDLKKAEENFAEALSIANKLKAVEARNKITFDLSKLYETKNDYKNALKFFTIYKQTNDSMINRENSEINTRTEIQYEYDKKQEHNLHEIEQIKMVRNLIIIGFAALLIILILVWRSRVRFHRQNKLLEIQKVEITEKSEEITAQRDEMKALNTTKDKFFNIIAHDLRSPFSSLINLTETLITNYDDISETEKLDLFKIVNKSAKDMHALLENLLEWARSQTGRICVSPESFNISSLVLANIELSKGAAEKKHITLYCKHNISTLVFADKNMINTVLRNIISNAIKFTNQNGSVIIDLFETGKMVEVIITDTGVGIEDEVLAKLFRLDTYITRRGTSDEKGTGLGLVICREFVEKNFGTISVLSTLGKGTQFSFTIPKA